MTIFDFTSGRVLSREEVNSLERLGPEIVRKYNALIEMVKPSSVSGIKWWASYLASRVTVEGSPLDQIGLFFLFEKNIHQYKKVIIDRKWQLDLVKKACKKNKTKIVVSYKKKSSWRLYAYRLKKLFTSLLLLKINILVSIPLRFVKRDKLKEVALIKLYAIDSSYKNKKFEDRYFPGLGDYIQGQTNDELYYLPTVSSTKLHSYINVLRCVAKDKACKFFLAEQFLSPIGVWKVFWTFFQSGKCSLKKHLIEGYDFGCLLKEDWLKNSYSVHSMHAIANYFSIEGMKKKGIKLSKFICWSEGQPLDKSLMLALNKFYPETRKIGYQGYIESNYMLATYPTDDEQKSRVLPDSIAVCSNHCVPNSKKFLPSAKVTPSPGFRLSAPSGKKRGCNNKIIVLFLLSKSPSEVEEHIELFKAVKSEKFNSQINFIIRPHPALVPNDKSCQQFFSQLPNLADDLLRADIAVSASSSTGVEALLAGCRVVALQSKKYFTRDAVGAIEFFRDKYELIYDHTDFIKIIEDYNKLRITDLDYKNFIVPVNKKTVADFYSCI